MHVLIQMIKHANICKIKFKFFNHRHYETHFYLKIGAIGQYKKKCKNVNILTL